MKRPGISLLLAVLLTPVAFAQKLEKIPAFSRDAPEKIKAALDPTGSCVFLPNTLPACDVWVAKDVPTSKRADAKGGSYPEFAHSQFLGVITFPKGGAHDFRGQTVRAGSYTMRYQLLPADGNHLGVAPYPIAEDPDPTATYDFGKLIELSAAVLTVLTRPVSE
jgi:hypothetical protein